MSKAAFLVLLWLLAATTVADDAKSGANPAPLDKPAAETLLKSKGLVRMENRYLLPVDADLPNLLRPMRAAKARAEANSTRRAQLERQIETANAAALSAMREMSVLSERLANIKKSDTRRYNEVVAQINQAELRKSEAMLAAESTTRQLRKLGDGWDDYVGLACALADKMQAAALQYEALAGDAEVSAALLALGAGGPRYSLGPSPAFKTELPAAMQAREVLAAKAIALTIENGVPHAAVVLNGKANVQMVVDSGAATVLLSATVAKECGLRPGKNDPLMTCMTADGKTTLAHVMKLQSVRVGPYTVADVECAVMPEGVRAHNLLGGTFLRNFICRMDLAAKELHMSPVNRQATVGELPAASAGTQPDRSTPAAVPAESGKPVRTTVIIAADKAWQPTIDVKAGDLIAFSATGLVTTNGGKPDTGPDGKRRSGRMFGRLRGQIGQPPNRELFMLGADSRHVAGIDGQLTLRADDDHGDALKDNHGEFKVVITHTPANKPPPTALGQSDQFVLPATDIILRMMKAGVYDVTAEGEWSALPEGPLYSAEGRNNGKDHSFAARWSDKDFAILGKRGRLTVPADGPVKFKIRDDEGGMADNRGSVNVIIRPAK